MAVTADETVARQLRSWWFCQVHDLSDIDLQRRTWLDVTNRNPHWSYIEFLESFPDDDQLSQARQEGWIAEEEAEILRKLGSMLVAYSPPCRDLYDHTAVLDDPAWHAVVEEARRARQQLLAMTNNPVDRENLLGTA